MMNRNNSSAATPCIDFVGDSMIERWDLCDYFENWHTRNYGRSGSGIDYIEMLKGRFSGREIVVMIGINDNENFASDKLQAYADRYHRAIVELGADTVHLFSVLPCAFGRNGDVEAFNAAIKKRLATVPGIHYIDAYPRFISQGAIKSQLYVDGLHLSPYGYEALTALLKSEIE